MTHEYKTDNQNFKIDNVTSAHRPDVLALCSEHARNYGHNYRLWRKWLNILSTDPSRRMLGLWHEGILIGVLGAAPSSKHDTLRTEYKIMSFVVNAEFRLPNNHTHQMRLLYALCESLGESSCRIFQNIGKQRFVDKTTAQQLCLIESPLSLKRRTQFSNLSLDLKYSLAMKLGINKHSDCEQEIGLLREQKRLAEKKSSELLEILLSDRCDPQEIRIYTVDITLLKEPKAVTPMYQQALKNVAVFCGGVAAGALVTAVAYRAQYKA